MVLIGVCGLLATHHYTGPFEALVHSYLGNVTVSFAVFFLACLPPALERRSSWVAAALALVAVEGFEATDGFGLMTNTYDRWDLLANLAGVALAWGLDTCLFRRSDEAGPSGGRAGRPEPA
jgi:hypothetical protein